MLLDKPYFQIIVSRWGWLCLALLVGMQLIVASSTLWLVALIQAVPSGNLLWLWLGLYFASLVLPYFPGVAALIVTSHWQMDVVHKFVNRFVRLHHEKVSLWSSQKEREWRTSLLATEGAQTYSQFIEYLHNFFACLLNVSLNVLVLAFVVEWRYLISYGASLLFAVLLMQYFNPRQSRIALEAQTARVEMGRSLLQGWDNILLGNKYSFNLWKGIFEDRFALAANKTIFSTRYKQLLSLFFTMVTLVPSFVVVVISVQQHWNNPLALSSLVVTLPRLFMILGFTHEILGLFSEWPIQKAKVEGLSRLDAVDEENLSRRIQWEQINSSNGSLDLLLDGSIQPGRWTLRGPNGCGKSSFLLLLKQKWGEKAFYLPAKNHLSFGGQEIEESTGQNLKRCLEEIAQNVNSPLLLLDEWDANLDVKNQRELSLVLDDISKTRRVVEVRHRV